MKITKIKLKSKSNNIMKRIKKNLKIKDYKTKNKLSKKINNITNPINKKFVNNQIHTIKITKK
mgnify:CR=1 FL=1